MKNISEAGLKEPGDVKSLSAVTTKEQSNTSHNPLKNKSYLTNSNKVSELKEEDEASSSQAMSKPAQKIENANILDLCEQFDEIIEEESDTMKKSESELSNAWIIFCFVVI